MGGQPGRICTSLAADASTCVSCERIGTCLSAVSYDPLLVFLASGKTPHQMEAGSHASWERRQTWVLRTFSSQKNSI